MGFEIQYQYLQNQQESLSISPENSGERVDCVAFSFMRGYNESEILYSRLPVKC